MDQQHSEFAFYPSPIEVDSWLDGIWEEALATECGAEPLPDEELPAQVSVRHLRGHQYVRFSPRGLDPFYAYWQPAPSQPAPLLVHTPGYGAEMSIHPDLVAQGFNVLHVNPLGYVTPAGSDQSKKRGGDTWPVFPDTVASRLERGYRQWLIDCVLAVAWAQAQDAVLPGRVSFFGSSQGGGGSLLLGSLYHGRGVRCVAADVPFMINYPLAKTLWPNDDIVRLVGLEGSADPAGAWRALGFMDMLSHAHRLTVPVLLTAGGADDVCSPATIETLFARLPHTRLYCFLHGYPHHYTQDFVTLAAAWFRLYA